MLLPRYSSAMKEAKNVEIKHFRGFKRVYMVTVLEGKGIEEDPYREVAYIYDDEKDIIIGNVDPYKS